MLAVVVLGVPAHGWPPGGEGTPSVWTAPPPSIAPIEATCDERATPSMNGTPGPLPPLRAPHPRSANASPDPQPPIREPSPRSANPPARVRFSPRRGESVPRRRVCGAKGARPRGAKGATRVAGRRPGAHRRGWGPQVGLTAASWPQAPSISLPRVSRTVVGMPRASSAAHERALVAGSRRRPLRPRRGVERDQVDVHPAPAARVEQVAEQVGAPRLVVDVADQRVLDGDPPPGGAA